MGKEWLARMLVMLLAIAALAVPFEAWRTGSQWTVIHARMAETGGWTPENLTAEAGVPLHLQLTSDDVMHGFAIGQSDGASVDVKPGEISEVTLTFDRPGKYIFYCTRWCSINHWRMRGTIEVTGPERTKENVKPPLYLALGLDIDASRQADHLPGQKPSAARGEKLGLDVPARYQRQGYNLSHSPEELWKALRAEISLEGLSDQQVWDLVAKVWQSRDTPQALQEGQQLYAVNCAACHGEQGAGDGVFAGQLARPDNGEGDSMETGEMTKRPADFTDPATMLAASHALLQGKIIRGGMGTGMPYWGPLFTEEQTWALVAYLWTFQFDLEDHP